jgi:formamidopyrimidine-DNA glycosylase
MEILSAIPDIGKIQRGGKTMFELPEYVILAKQINATLRGKTVRSGVLGNKPHKFVWYNRSHAEFAQLTPGKQIGEARSQGRWLFIPFEPGYVLVFGECGGKILYHPPGTKSPKTYHLLITFDDDSALSAMTQMWGAMELYEQGRERERQYIKGMRPTPIDPAFTFAYFCNLVDSLATGKKRSVKELLTQEQLIPGLGNAIAQDIMFHANLHPKRDLRDLNPGQQQALYDAIRITVQAVIQKGGRYDEYDLFGMSGQYVRLMDKAAVGQPCPRCQKVVIEKIQYLGGACYFCPNCQQ